MFPVFFSVSDKDVAVAEKIWKRFPAHLIYLYSANGDVGADMWEEIAERELPYSRGLVIFWSKNYIESSGTVRELYQASNLFQEGILNNILVVRLDDTPIFDDGATDQLRAVYDALKPFLKFRTTETHATESAISVYIERFIETVVPSEHPKLHRAELLEDFRARARKDRFNCFPTMWVSGLNGVGRQTTTIEVNKYFVPNGNAFIVNFNEATTPKQAVLRLSEEAFGLGIEGLAKLQSSIDDDDVDELSDVIKRVAQAGHYVVLRQTRIIDENVDPPEWINELALNLPDGNRPKLYVISQIPLRPDRRDLLGQKMNDIRITTVDEHTMTEFAWQLIGHFDKNPARWDDDLLENVIQSSAGTMGLLVTILRTAASLESLEAVTEFAGKESERIAVSLTAYARWAFARLDGDFDAQRALTFLNDVSPCHADDIALVLNSDSPISSILGRLLELGLVEREDSGLYRLTPLLSNRLSRDLITPTLLDWQNSVLRNFAKEPIDFEASSNDFVRIEARLQASFWSEEDEVPPVIKQFQSAAHWLQAGIRLYSAKRYPAAYRVLKRAFQERQSFRDGTRMEVVRYFALSAIRFRKYDDVDLCITILNSDHRSHDIAAFVEAFQEETKGHYISAVELYQEALQGALDSNQDRRLERIYRPLINCILKSPIPNFQLAEKYAVKNVELRKTLFSLSILARLYLDWQHVKPQPNAEERDRIRALYEEALEDLRTDAGGVSAYHEIKAEEAVHDGELMEAKRELDKAVSIGEPRFELRLRRWEIMIRTGDAGTLAEVVAELHQIRNDGRHRTEWETYMERLAALYGRALKEQKAFDPRKIEQFAPELSQSERGGIIARLRRS